MKLKLPTSFSSKDFNEHIEKLRAQYSEQIRLLSCISYALWLKEHGIDTCDIKGHSSEPIPKRQIAWQNCKSWFRNNGLTMPERVDKLIAYKMKDGTEICLPWPPYERDVIHNQSRLPKEESNGS